MKKCAFCTVTLFVMSSKFASLESTISFSVKWHMTFINFVCARIEKIHSYSDWLTDFNCSFFCMRWYVLSTTYLWITHFRVSFDFFFFISFHLQWQFLWRDNGEPVEDDVGGWIPDTGELCLLCYLCDMVGSKIYNCRICLTEKKFSFTWKLYTRRPVLWIASSTVRNFFMTSINMYAASVNWIQQLLERSSAWLPVLTWQRQFETL